MSNIRGTGDFPGDSLADFPHYVRLAAFRLARAGQAVRVYRRRGWNPSAVLLQRDRAKAELLAAIDKYEREQMNPRLF